MKSKYVSPFADLIGYSTGNKVRPNKYRSEFQFDYIDDADVVKKLKSVPSKTDYVKRLIREDLRLNLIDVHYTKQQIQEEKERRLQELSKELETR